MSSSVSLISVGNLVLRGSRRGEIRFCHRRMDLGYNQSDFAQTEVRDKSMEDTDGSISGKISRTEANASSNDTCC